MERRRGGVCACFVLFATFLTLAAAQRSRPRGGAGQALALLTQPERVYYVSRKVPANITCEALAASAISFTCGGAQVPPSSQMTYESYDESRGQNRIRSTIQVTRTDVANHQRRLAQSGGAREDFWCECVAEDITSGATQRSRRAIVRLAYMRKRFQEEPASQTVDLGSQAVFRCVAPQGQPSPEIIWRKDGRRVDADKDANFVVGADNSLSLRSVRAQDAGSYECVAKNHAVRRTSAPATLTIRERAREVPTTEGPQPEAGMEAKPVFLEKPPQTIYLKRDKSVQFICSIQGTQRMTLRCNGQRVRSGQMLKVEPNPESNSVHLDFTLTYADVENYLNSFSENVYQCECVAWYRSSQDDRSWEFVTSNISDIYLASLKKRFEEEPRDLTVEEGKTATLVCRPPEGRPNPYVRWVFEQQILDPRSDPHYKVEEDGSLIIRNVRPSDEGRYYCVAENDAGARNSRVAHLTVRAPAPQVIPDTPMFTQDLKPEYYINMDGEAALECTVMGADRLTIRCNNDRVPPNKQSIQSRRSPDGQIAAWTGRMTVTAEDLYQAPGEVYSCECVAWYVADGRWATNSSTVAVVKLPYLDHQFRYDPKGVVVSVGDSAEFGCEAPDGQPKPKLTWLKDNEPIDPAQDSNFIILDDSTLIVEYVRASDAGEYTCLANNSAGERISQSAHLELDDESLIITTTTPEADATTSTTTAQPPPTSTSTTFYTTTPHHPGDGQTTMMSSSTTTTAASMMGGSLPIFTLRPDKQIFILRNQPAVLRCGAMQMTALHFYCNGQKMQEEADDLIRSIDPTPGLTYKEKSIEIQRQDVMAFEGPGPFTCQCRAYYQPEDGQEGQQDYLATDSVIEAAFLKKRFEESPMDKTVPAGDRVELRCRPPQGVPEPRVEWLKDGFSVQQSQEMQITAEGSLLFPQIELSDAGNYTCTAANVATTRYSDTVALRVTAVVGHIPTAMPSDLGDATTSTTSSTSTMTGPVHGGELMTTAEGDEDEDQDQDGDGLPETTPEGEPGADVYPEATPEGGAGGDSVHGEGVDPESGNMVEVDASGPAGEHGPVFIAEPEDDNFIIKSRPVVIYCQTQRAERVTFACNGNNLPQSRVHYQNNIVEGQDDQLMASIEVSREEVENYLSQQGDDTRFYCQCHAHYRLPGMDTPEYLISSKGYVEVAYLRKTFRRVPENITVAEGDFVSLHCEPPEGNPQPETKWMKDEEEVQGDLSTPDGALVFQSISAANSGTYYCQASNLANTRTSHPAIIVVTAAHGGGLESGRPGHEGGGGPFQPGAGSEEAKKECVAILKGCSDSMPQPQRDQEGRCQSLEVYMSCVDDFIQRCGHVVNKASLRSAENARDSALRICNKDREEEGGGAEGEAEAGSEDNMDHKDNMGNMDNADNMDNMNNMDNVDNAGGVNPGQSLGHDDGEDKDNSAWTVHASALLTSLLSVLFAMTACR